MPAYDIQALTGQALEAMRKQFYASPEYQAWLRERERIKALQAEAAGLREQLQARNSKSPKEPSGIRYVGENMVSRKERPWGG